jgi:hypothetical protein
MPIEHVAGCRDDMRHWIGKLVSLVREPRHAEHVLLERESFEQSLDVRRPSDWSKRRGMTVCNAWPNSAGDVDQFGLYLSQVEIAEELNRLLSSQRGQGPRDARDPAPNDEAAWCQPTNDSTNICRGWNAQSLEQRSYVRRGENTRLRCGTPPGAPGPEHDLDGALVVGVRGRTPVSLRASLSLLFLDQRGRGLKALATSLIRATSVRSSTPAACRPAATSRAICFVAWDFWAGNFFAGTPS